MPDEQEKWLERSFLAINQQVQLMGLCFDRGAPKEGLHYCANMLRELRTSDLSPKAYYELYVKSTDVLNDLEAQLTDEFQNNRPLPHLYETVQYAAHILPRLYLLITVGVVSMKAKVLPCCEVLPDLVEMCRGVQHPMRGLFLRNYLLSSVRPSLLPDIEAFTPGVEDDGNRSVTQDGTVIDSVNFFLNNFAEMNKLWVRMQHQGHTRDREKREQERRDLRVLVGANLNRISQLESVSAELYTKHILPHILEQIIQCRDVIAQEYLMDVIIQAFPDEFHAASLSLLLGACEQLHPAVRLKPILSSLIERLLRFASSTDTGDADLRVRAADFSSSEPSEGSEIIVSTKSKEEFTSGLLTRLSRQIDCLIISRAQLYEANVAESRLGLPPEDIPGLFAPLLYTAMRLHPNNSANLVNEALLAAANALERLGPRRIQADSPLSRELLRLLYTPIFGPGVKPVASDSVIGGHLSMGSASNAAGGEKSLGELEQLSSLVGLTGMRRLLQTLDPGSRRCLGALLISRLLDREVSCPSGNPELLNTYRACEVADVDGLLVIAESLIRPTLSATAAMDEDEDEEDDLCLLASLIHIIGPRPRSSDPDKCFHLLSITRKWLAAAGAVALRATFPALITEVIQLLPVFYEQRERYETWEEKVESVIQFCHQTITNLVTVGASDAALKTFLSCAQVIDSVSFKKQVHFAYEFFSQAFTLFEQELSQSRSQLSALCLIVATLVRMRHTCRDAENFGVLRTQCMRTASHLLLRPDQSRALAIVSHLFWTDDSPSSDNDDMFHDAKGLLSCLDKVRGLADICMDLDARVQLYIDLVNYHIKFKLLKCPEITEDRLMGLMLDIENQVGQLDQLPDSIYVYLENTKKKLTDILNTSATS